MAKRARSDAGDKAVSSDGGGAFKAPRPKRDGGTADKASRNGSKQPEIAARELNASQIRHRGFSSTSKFAQLQVLTDSLASVAHSSFVQPARRAARC